MTINHRLENIRQKIEHLKEVDQGKAIFGVEKHQYRLNPPLNADDLNHFESTHQLTLPEEYRQFLTEIADGGAGPYYGLLSLKKGEEQAIIASTESNEKLSKPCSIEFPFNNQSVAELIRRHDECIANGDDDEITYPEVPDPLTGAIFLSEYGCGWTYILVVKGEQAGTIWLHGDDLRPVFNKKGQWTFFDWYENWLNRSLDELNPNRVEKPIDANKTIINYDGWNLKEIPPEVFANKGLKKLVFSRNDLRKFPLEILQFTELRTLDLSMTPIVRIPGEISQLSHLRKLRLNYNNHLTLPAALADLTELQEISMYYNYKIKKIPAVVGRIKSLKRLDFAYCNSLKEIPESIGNLEELESLHLNDSPIEELPESIGKLTALKHLYLGNSRLTHLPASMNNLKNLETLDINIEGLNLDEAFNIICELPNLQTLSLVNHLHYPNTLGKLHSVKRLFIHNNYNLLRQGYKRLPVPENITLLTNLEELDLSNNNQAQSLPENIGKLKALKRMDVSATAIQDFPDSLQQTSLEVIEGLLSQKNNPDHGIPQEVKEKVMRWFPKAKIWIW